MHTEPASGTPLADHSAAGNTPERPRPSACLLKGKQRVLREGAVQVAGDDLINVLLAKAA